MKYCSHCGSTVSHKVPPGDNLPRFVCDKCQTVHYQNPKIIAGCIPEWNNKVLLCKRAIEPRYGLWTLPAGFMENLETAPQGAAREAIEEANASVINLSLFCTFSIPHISQVYMMFRGELKDGQASAGDESLEVDLFSEENIPWNELAFPVIQETLLLYFKDKKAGKFEVHSGDIVRQKDKIVVSHY